MKISLDGVVYPPEELLRYYVREAVLTRTTLGRAFHLAARRFAERVAIMDMDSGRCWSYSEMDSIADRFAAALLGLGLRPLDRIVVQLTNRSELFFCLYGCFKAGIIPIAALVSHREAEIAHLAGVTAARAHIVDMDYKQGALARVAEEVARTSPAMTHCITVGGASGEFSLAFDRLIEAQDPEQAGILVEATDVDPFNVAIMQLSGGTTGIPKIIPRFHSEYLYNMECWADASAYDESTIVYWPMPIIHNAGLVCGAAPAHLRGGRVVLQQGLDAQSLFRVLDTGRVTTTIGPIPLIVRMIDSGQRSHHNLSTVRDFLTAGETALVGRELGVPGFHIFGMSEGMCTRTRPDHSPFVRENTVGQPISPHDEIRLLHPGTEQEVTLGEIGELCCRGPYTIRGYYKAPEHDVRAFTSDGFYRSGDLMRAWCIDGEIYYSFEGRIKDNIDRGGEKISAEEIEHALAAHEAIREVAVVGMPDREFGERVCAFIIAQRPDPTLSVEGLQAFLLSKGMAKFKCPERVELVDTFPVTDVGKVSKPELRKMIAALLAQT